MQRKNELKNQIKQKACAFVIPSPRTNRWVWKQIPNELLGKVNQSRFPSDQVCGTCSLIESRGVWPLLFYNKV